MLLKQYSDMVARVGVIKGSTGLDIQVGFASHLTDFSAEMVGIRAGNWPVNLSLFFTLLLSFPSAFSTQPIQMASLGFLTPCPSQNE